MIRAFEQDEDCEEGDEQCQVECLFDDAEHFFAVLLEHDTKHCDEGQDKDASEQFDRRLGGV